MNDEMNKTDGQNDNYEEICYICRRPESKAGKMMKLPTNISICSECMQKTFDAMNNTPFPMGGMGFDMAGFGRTVFAYPQFANDILKNGGMKKENLCICCSKCTELMRAGGTPGCIIKDKDVYAPLYKEFCIRK